MHSSGDLPKGTAGALPADVIARADIYAGCQHLRIVNEGAVNGFFSVDTNDTVWHRLKAGADVVMDCVSGITAVRIKREAATDMSGVFASIW